MDALVEGLMEELNCETVFTIPLFGGIPVYESVVVTWIIMAVVFLLCILLSRNLSVENPSRRQVVVETAIKGLNDFFTETVGEKGKAYIPYLSAIAIYIGIANLIGLLGFKPPTKDMNVTARALPDVRDGLKPVQRRVLYAMDQLGLNYDKPHRKSARIVGDTMGKYHPHGDSSIYETLVVLSQDFKKGMALVDGHGNFGSIEGDGAAAMRYTEAKLKKFTQDVYLADLDKNVVDFVPNFDETEKEPEVLPVRVPNLLVNGADGIAVGMTTNIPPHNLSEVVDAVCAYMDNEDITTDELMQLCPGPDFPTGGIVINKSELGAIYETGTGKIIANVLKQV